ncbi:hypothetical protein GW17_00040721 [Ensete ventricosum]|nr:hypothetical protein GW17_00040721 [Ensete ventricosum]
MTRMYAGGVKLRTKRREGRGIDFSSAMVSLFMGGINMKDEEDDESISYGHVDACVSGRRPSEIGVGVAGAPASARWGGTRGCLPQEDENDVRSIFHLQRIDGGEQCGQRTVGRAMHGAANQHGLVPGSAAPCILERLHAVRRRPAQFRAAWVWFVALHEPEVPRRYRGAWVWLVALHELEVPRWY